MLKILESFIKEAVYSKYIVAHNGHTETPAALSRRTRFHLDAYGIVTTALARYSWCLSVYRFLEIVKGNKLSLKITVKLEE